MTCKEAAEIYYIRTEIKSLKEELAQHERDRRYYKTVLLSDMPRGRGARANLMDEHLIKEQELKDMIRHSLDRLQDELLKFEGFLASVEDVEVRTILRLRCINNMGWEQIGDRMHMDRRTASRKFQRFFAQGSKLAES